MSGRFTGIDSEVRKRPGYESGVRKRPKREHPFRIWSPLHCTVDDDRQQESYARAARFNGYHNPPPPWRQHANQ